MNDDADDDQADDDDQAGDHPDRQADDEAGDLPDVRVKAERAIRFVAEIAESTLKLAAGTIHQVAERAVAALSEGAAHRAHAAREAGDGDQVTFPCPACKRRAVCHLMPEVLPDMVGVTLTHDMPPCRPFLDRDQRYLQAIEGEVTRAVHEKHPAAAPGPLN